MEQLVPQPIRRRYTAEEYLRMEEASDSKHEFRDGQIVDMAGAGFRHNDIAGNVLAELRLRLKGGPCKAVGSDTRVRIAGTDEYRYPDVTVVCGPQQFDPPDRDHTLLNPRVLVEVTSPSSDSYDRTEKFEEYMTIDTLEEYVVVAQDRLRVNSFYRQSDGIWAIGPTAGGRDASVVFRTLGITLQMSQIYDGIEFSTGSDDPTA